MEIFRFKKLDAMGFEMEEEFFLTKDKAVNHYKEKLNDYRRSERRTKTEDLAILEKQFSRYKSLLPGKRIVEHRIEVWEKTSYEYDEWDTTINMLVLETVTAA